MYMKDAGRPAFEGHGYRGFESSELELVVAMRLLSSLFAVAALPALISAFPNVPFKRENQWVVDSTGANFTYVGLNWPGHGEAMIPEGLQYQSIQTIVSRIKSLNMNSVRLTFAIEMVDNIKDGGDVTLEKAFNTALGNNGSTILADILRNNPQFSSSTTRLQVRGVDFHWGFSHLHETGLRRSCGRTCKAADLRTSRQPYVKRKVVLQRK